MDIILGPYITENYADKFEWYEYVVFTIVLAASLGIGIFYGCFGTKNKTNEEFLMAGRSMTILPVALSLVCSFVSAITLLGNPVEIYFYGFQYTAILLAFIPMTLVLCYLYVPVYFSLQLTSAYQYFEWRFSKKVRFILSVFACVHLVFYMPITIYGPCLALDQDVLQAFVMFAALFAVIGFGMVEIGGFEVMWQRAEETGRTMIHNFDPDLRTRHTVWTSTIGGFLLWLPLFAATQAQLQRYNSVPSLKQSQLCLYLNMFGMMLIMMLCSWIGLMIFARYYDCDPVKTEKITLADQLLPLFVMDALGDYPVLPGLFVAGLTCGSLSTVSSALNSLTAIITEDYVKTIKKGLSETTLGLISKCISTVAGLVAFGLVFIVAEVNKTINISPFSTLIHGSLLGPILGAYTLGLFVPWANDIGTLSGIIVAILISGYVGLGTILAGRIGLLPDQRLSLDNCGCPRESIPPSGFPVYDLNCTSPAVAGDTWKVDSELDSFSIKAWSLSYIWGPGIGSITTIIFGVLFSFIIICIDRKSDKRVNKSLLSKPFMRLWKKCFGEKYMSNYIDPESPDYCGGAAAGSKTNTSDIKNGILNDALKKSEQNGNSSADTHDDVRDNRS